MAIIIPAKQLPKAKVRVSIDSKGETQGGYYSHIFKLRSVIRNMLNRGVPIDTAILDSMHSRLEIEREELNKSIYAHIDGVVKEKRKLAISDYVRTDYYKTLPPPVRKRLDSMAEVTSKIARCKNKETGKFEQVEVEVRTPPQITIDPEAKYPTFYDDYQGWFKEMVTEMGYQWVDDIENYALTSFIADKREFNPDSPKQIMEYCKLMGYRVPSREKKSKTKGREIKDTTDDKALEELIARTKDPVFEMIQQLRENSKLDGTYVEGWRPNGSDGRLHSTFKFKPATGQLSSTNPNIQNAHKMIKTAVVAREGRVILNVDYTGYHAQLLGYLAGDPLYMRLSVLGIHDFLAANILRVKLDQQSPETQEHLQDLPKWLTLEDKVLKAKLKWIKSNHPVARQQAKSCVHGIGFGMGVRKFYDMNRTNFSSLKEAEEVRGLMRKLFPKIFEFQDKIVEQAHRDKYLISPYGYVRRFWEAKVWRSGQMVKGEDAEKAIAFLPANTAFSIKKEALLRLEEIGANEQFWLWNEVHDSVMYEPEEKDLDEAIRIVVQEMTRPVMRLANEICPQGLKCAVEVSVGKSWDKLEVVAI